MGRRPLVPSSANGVSGECSIIIPLYLANRIGNSIVQAVNRTCRSFHASLTLRPNIIADYCNF